MSPHTRPFLCLSCPGMMKLGEAEAVPRPLIQGRKNIFVVQRMAVWFQHPGGDEVGDRAVIGAKCSFPQTPACVH